MKKIFEITDKEVIDEILNNAEFGTLALCRDNRPYSLPLNFTKLENNIYFHGAKKGKKIEIIKKNNFASFSVTEAYSLIPSYFSSSDKSACPATQFFKSIIIDGEIEFIDNYEEKVLVLESLMQKLQKEGKYNPLNDKSYKKAIDATEIFKLKSNEIKAKFKFGQNLNREKFDMVIKHLKERGDEKDLKTIELIKSFKIE